MKFEISSNLKHSRPLEGPHVLDRAYQGMVLNIVGLAGSLKRGGHQKIVAYPRDRGENLFKT